MIAKIEQMLKPFHTEGVVEAGCDEAGRGCLAGPVFAAAVILPPDFHNDLLNDSKQLTERQRYALREVIEREAVAWAVAECTPEEIDRLNILRCSILAMQRALDALCVRPQHVIVDGNRWRPYVPAAIPPGAIVNQGWREAEAERTGDSEGQRGVAAAVEGNAERAGDGERQTDVGGTMIPAHTIVKGDATYMSIAAASVLAKTYRDDRMKALAKEYPQYGWDRNMGYPAKAHRDAIRQFGPTPYHRMTFRLLPDDGQLTLGLE